MLKHLHEDEIERKLSKFQDPTLKKILEQLYRDTAQGTYCEKMNARKIILCIDENATKEQATVDWFLNIHAPFKYFYRGEYKDICPKMCSHIAWSKFIMLCVQNEFYTDPSFEKLLTPTFMFFYSHQQKNTLYNILSEHKSFGYVQILVTKANKSKNKINRLIVKFDTNNLNFQNRIIVALNAIGLKNEITEVVEAFFGNIAKSLDYQLPLDYIDFTPEMMKKQYRYYNSMNLSEYTRWRLVMILKKFYLFVFDLDDTKFIEAGITRNLLANKFFFKYVDSKEVYIDPLKPIPKFDMWAVRYPVNSQTSGDASNIDSYAYMDFTGLNDEMKFLCKSWVWNYPVSIHQKNVYLNSIIPFCKAHQNNKVVGIKDSPNKLSYREVSLYINKHKKNYIIFALRVFIMYIYHANLYPVDKYLITNFPANNYKPNNNSSPIPNDELKKILSLLWEKAKNPQNRLSARLIYYIIQILLLSDIRITSLLAMNLDDVAEKDGNYLLTYRTKTGKNHRITKKTDKFVFELFVKVIELTAEVRKQLDDNVKNHLFVGDEGVLAWATFKYYIKKYSMEAVGKSYTAQNFRDTYMTRIYQEAHKAGVGDVMIAGLTGHKQWKTPFEHYISYDEAQTFADINTLDILAPPD